MAESEPKAFEPNALKTPQEQPTKAEKKKGIQLSESIKEALDAADAGLDRAKKGLGLMAAAIESQPARLSEFWEIRALVVHALQDPQIDVPPETATQLQELCQKARELKEQQEAQSLELQKSFEEELSLLEIDCAHIEEAVRACEPITDWPACMGDDIDELKQLQPGAAVLAALANRLTEVRQRVLKAGMRTRAKNALLARIAKSGDQVFPKRKEHGARLSQIFEASVAKFLEAHFVDGQVSNALNIVREEIKSLQAVAKLLFLPVGVFNRQRQKLGEAWESLKKAENERKKERQQKSQQSKELMQSIEEKLAELQSVVTEVCQGASSDSKLEDVRKVLRELLRGGVLKREQAQHYRERIKELEQPLDEKKQAEKQAKKRASQAKEDAYAQRVEQYTKTLKQLGEPVLSDDPEPGLRAIQNFIESLNSAALLSVDRDKLRIEAAMLKDALLQQLIQVVADARLPQAVEAVRQRKSELKASIDNLRREKGSGGNDLTRGLYLDELLGEEKQRLDQIIDLLYQGERRLYDLQSG